MPFILFAQGTPVTPTWLNAVALNDGATTVKGINIDGTGAVSTTATARTIAFSGGAAAITATAALGITSVGAMTLTGSAFTFATGDIAATASTTSVKRIKSAGQVWLGGEVVLSAGWGATAALVNPITARDMSGEITILAQGGGYLANPTMTITYKDGTWTGTPIMVVNAYSSDDATFPVNHAFCTSGTATTAVITLVHTPVATRNYTLKWHVIGFAS